MANTTYVSAVVDTQPKRKIAYDKLRELCEHLSPATGGYTMDIVSIVHNSTTKIITVIVTNPLPQGPGRFLLTLV